MSIASTFLAVQTMLNQGDPELGRQGALMECLSMVADEAAIQGITLPPPAGATDPRGDRANLVAAAQAALDVGEPGTYLSGHDALVYTPAEALTTLHRYLQALGWTTTTVSSTVATPDPVPNPSGRAGVLVYADISNYQAGIDLGALKAAGYAGLVAKIGQGAGYTTDRTPQLTFGATLDDSWPGWRPTAQTLWGQRFMGYWYPGNTESPASQAARCRAAIGDPAIPVMLDWEDGAGDWENLKAVLAAFRAAGLKVTTLYANPSYASAHGASQIDALGLALVRPRYYVSTYATPASLYSQMPADSWNAYSGGTPRVVQFSQNANLGIAGWSQGVDVDAFRGTMDQLAAMFQGATTVQQVVPSTTPGVAPPLFAPAVWRAALDQNGLTGTHDQSQTNLRVPTTSPPGLVVDAQKWRLPGGRQGFAYAVNLPAGAQRCEVQPTIASPKEGDELWFGFSMMLGRNVPVDLDRFHTLFRFRNVTDGSYPLGMIVRGGAFKLASAYDIELAPADTLVWHDVIMRVKFSRYPGVGTVDVYFDGRQVLANYAPPGGTLTPDATATGTVACALRYGLYRDTAAPSEATVWHMNWAVGTSMGSVVLPGSG